MADDNNNGNEQDMEYLKQQAEDYVKQRAEKYFAIGSRAKKYSKTGLGVFSEVAVKNFTDAIKLNPSHAEAYIDRGAARLVLGQKKKNRKESLAYFEGALADYDKAIELGFSNAEIYNNRGYAHVGIGNFQQALADFDKVIELNPNLIEAYISKGVVNDALGNHQQALAYLDRAYQLDSGFFGSDYSKIKREARVQTVQKEKVINEGRDKQAKEYLNSGVEKIQKYEPRKSDYHQAINDFAKAIELKPDYTKAYYNRGVVNHWLGDQGQALTDYNQAIELDPKNALAYNIRGGLLFEIGQKEEHRQNKIDCFESALANFDLAIEIDPDNQAAIINRETMLTKIAQEKRAIIKTRLLFGAVIIFILLMAALNP